MEAILYHIIINRVDPFDIFLIFYIAHVIIINYTNG